MQHVPTPVVSDHHLSYLFDPTAERSTHSHHPCAGSHKHHTSTDTVAPLQCRGRGAAICIIKPWLCASNIFRERASLWTVLRRTRSSSSLPACRTPTMKCH
jgi:hypothetical protein